MTTEDRNQLSAGRLALLALPVVCCVGHAALLGLGAGSLAAITGTVTGNVLIAVAGLVLSGAAPAAAVIHSGHR